MGVAPGTSNARDYVLYELPLWELNQLLHMHWFNQGREVRSRARRDAFLSRAKRAFEELGIEW
jgi:hypothetical protein